MADAVVCRLIDKAPARAEYRVRLSPEELLALISTIVDEERLGFSLSGYAGQKPFLGRVSQEGFRIQKRRSYRNDFHPFLFGEVERAPGGSIVRWHIGMSAWTKWFMRVWFGFLAIFSVVWIPGMLVKFSEGDQDAVWWSLHPVGMALFGWGLIRFGQWLGRNEELALREWLRDTLSGVITNATQMGNATRMR